MKKTWTIATFNLWGFNPEQLEIPGETRYISGLTSDRVVGLEKLLLGEDADVIGLQETSTWRSSSEVLLAFTQSVLCTVTPLEGRRSRMARGIGHAPRPYGSSEGWMFTIASRSSTGMR